MKKNKRTKNITIEGDEYTEEEFRDLRQEMFNKMENLNSFQQLRLQTYFKNNKIKGHFFYSSEDCIQSEKDNENHSIYNCAKNKYAIKSLKMRQLELLKGFIEEMECKKCGWE